jgi:hypothetical protein
MEQQRTALEVCTDSAIDFGGRTWEVYAVTASPLSQSTHTRLTLRSGGDEVTVDVEDSTLLTVREKVDVTVTAIFSGGGTDERVRRHWSAAEAVREEAESNWHGDTVTVIETDTLAVATICRAHDGEPIGFTYIAVK